MIPKEVVELLVGRKLTKRERFKLWLHRYKFTVTFNFDKFTEVYQNGKNG